MAEDLQSKMQAQYGLRERDAKVACHLAEALRHLFDLVETQSPAILEALIAYNKDLQKPDSTAPRHRREFREAVRKHLEQCLEEQRKLERMLFTGMGGEID